MNNPELVNRLYGFANHPGPLQTLCNEAGDVLGAAHDVLAWLDERGRNSQSYGSHADAYEIAARKLREALDAPPPKSFADIADDGPTAA